MTSDNLYPSDLRPAPLDAGAVETGQNNPPQPLSWWIDTILLPASQQANDHVLMLEGSVADALLFYGALTKSGLVADRIGRMESWPANDSALNGWVFLPPAAAQREWESAIARLEGWVGRARTASDHENMLQSGSLFDGAVAWIEGFALNVFAAGAEAAIASQHRASEVDSLARRSFYLAVDLAAVRRVAMIESALSRAAMTRATSTEALARADLTAIELSLREANSALLAAEQTAADERRLRDINEAAWLDAETRAEQLAAEVESLRARLASQQSETSPARGEGDEQPRGRKKLAELIETTLETFLPTVDLLRNSLEFIETEIRDYRSLLVILHKLQSDHLQVKARPIRQAAGWFECRYSTGEEGDGRLYFRHRNGRAAVLVSGKWTQERDLDWLSRQA